jgi:hypothetical protein
MYIVYIIQVSVGFLHLVAMWVELLDTSDILQAV